MPPIRPPTANQERLYRAIADALFVCVDEDWDEILLQMEPAGSELRFVISGPRGIPTLRVPDDSLYEHGVELYDLFVRAKCPFARCDFHLRWDDAKEKWRFTADFTYPPGCEQSP